MSGWQCWGMGVLNASIAIFFMYKYYKTYNKIQGALSLFFTLLGFLYSYRAIFTFLSQK